MAQSARNWVILAALALVPASSVDCGDHADEPLSAATRWKNLAPIANPNPDVPQQPTRKKPHAVAMTRDGATALVALRGSELEPADEVAFLDVARRTVTGRLQVGARPHAVRIHPKGRFALVLSQFSPLASVIDLSTHALAGTIEVGYYAQDLVFDAKGDRMFVTNRASDEVQLWKLGSTGSTLTGTLVAAAPAGRNPDCLGLAPSGDKLYVCDEGGLGLRVYGAEGLDDRAFIDFNAPLFDVKAMGSSMVVTTLNDTNGLPCAQDADFIGVEGDGIFPMVTDRTCSRGFADVQNEIAFIDVDSDTIAVRFTSDSAQISEADREGDHAPELRRVVGSLPQVVAVVDDTHAYVTMSASNELVELTLSSGPSSMDMPRVWATGFAPRGLAVDAAGTVAVVADKLGETVTIVDLAGAAEPATVVVGNVAPAFPATSFEIGEMFAHSAKFATDGDISCTHCHPDVTADAKSWGVPVVRGFGRRATMILRNLFATKPLLIEGVFNENDFRLEMEGISFRPDFHDSSYTLQVERRDQFYREVSLALVGKAIGFDEMVAHVGSFLVGAPRLLPSPFDETTEQVERGAALFARPDVGCANCHVPPTFANDKTFKGVTTLGRYDLPARDLDPDVSVKFIEEADDGFFNANGLRGLWDRPGALFHDGRARTIREAILTPGHPCLRDDERAFNEFNGQVDTNGGVSQLTCDQVDDLVAFLKTID